SPVSSNSCNSCTDIFNLSAKPSRMASSISCLSLLVSDWELASYTLKTSNQAADTFDRNSLSHSELLLCLRTFSPVCESVISRQHSAPWPAGVNWNKLFQTHDPR